MKHRVYALNDGQKVIIKTDLTLSEAQNLVDKIKQDVKEGKRGALEKVGLEPIRKPDLEQKQLVECHNGLIENGANGISFKPNRYAVKPNNETPLFKTNTPSHEQGNLF